MRKQFQIGLSAVALSLVAVPAAARDGAWYVGGDFGGMIVDDIHFDIGPTDDALVLRHDTGLDGALFVGYDLGAFRLEGEVSYKRTEVDGFENSIAIPSSSGPHPVGEREGFGAETALSFMINGMLDFGDDDGISGFVGGGAGIARVDYANIRAFQDTGEFLDESDSAFAWQVVAGLRQSVSRNVDVTARYRFFNVESLDLRTFGNDDAAGRRSSHSLLFGLTFNFGAPPQ